MDTLVNTHEHVEGEKISITSVAVMVPGKHESKTYMLSPRQAELHRRLGASPRPLTINNITTYLEVIGNMGEYRERALATLDENTLHMMFHIDHTDESVSAQYIVGEGGTPDMVQYYPDTLVGKSEELSTALLRFRSSVRANKILS